MVAIREKRSGREYGDPPPASAGRRPREPVVGAPLQETTGRGAVLREAGDESRHDSIAVVNDAPLSTPALETAGINPAFNQPKISTWNTDPGGPTRLKTTGREMPVSRPDS